jgi:hypothetical protein
MGKQTTNYLNYKKGILLSLIFSLFFVITSFGQSEKDRNNIDVPRANDTTTELQDNSAYDFRNDAYNRPVVKDQKPGQAILKKENPLYKQGSDKDIKKESMSTLSFNLFLYIVDKFRED